MKRLFLHLWRLHVEHFGDPALHDEEVGVVHVQLDGAEKVLDTAVLAVGAVDQVLVLAANNDLNCEFVLASLQQLNLLNLYLSHDGHFVEPLVPDGALLLVAVVEGDGHGGLGDACLAVLVHQLLHVGGADLKTRG